MFLGGLAGGSGHWGHAGVGYPLNPQPQTLNLNHGTVAVLILASAS